MPDSPFSPGSTTGGPPTLPLDPHILDVLLCRDPARAATFLAAMRPSVRDAQAIAHAEICGADVARIREDWARLINAAAHASYDPELFALLEPYAARQIIAALGPEQRVAQVRAQARWLAGFGYPVTADELLASLRLRPPSPAAAGEGDRG
jgi:hypothetical protein